MDAQYMSQEQVPAVSVIVCTYNRHDLLRHAIASVLEQDYTDFEAIVVDDGSVPPVDLSAIDDERIRLIRTEHGGVGAARQAGLDAARGQFVAYCDDDDTWTPDHLSTLVDYLHAHPAVDLVYGDSWWVQDGGPPSVAYSVEFSGWQLSHGNYVFAHDVLHRTNAARVAGGFCPELQAYEDWDLWLRMSRTGTLRHLPTVVGTHCWHGANVEAGDHWEDWMRVYQAHQSWFIRTGPVAEHDLAVEAACRSAFEPGTWDPATGRRELIWCSLFQIHEGYGSVGYQLLRAVEGQSVDVIMAPSRNQPMRGMERFYRPLDHWGRIAFYYHYRATPGVLPAERIVNYTMWESTAVPEEHVREINRSVSLQYLPCRQNVESYRACGVQAPLKVLHHGVDSARFPFLERDRRDCFTFGTFGDLTPRKGTDVLIRAFLDEFDRAEPVRLLLKSTSKAHQYAVDDPRVRFVTGVLDQPALLEVLREMDAFVLPSRGEGFGLCGLEAMSTGLPLIATNWSGPAEYLDAADSFPLRYGLVDAKGVASNHVRYFGQWAEPDYEHLRYLMRWLFEHPGEAGRHGEMASRRVHRDWTWERVARQLVRDLDELARE